MNKIYFDNAATTQLHPKVKEKILPYLSEHFGNPSSIHSFGRDVRVAIEDARETVAEFINADPSEIYFTSGGTESNNFAIKGIANTVYSEDKRNIVLTSEADHHAVLDTVLDLNKSGLSGKVLKCDKESNILHKSIVENCNEMVSLIATIHINNETGAKNDVKSISKLARDNGNYFHVDAVQSYGKIKLDVNELGVDTLSASGHKIHALKGSGILYAKNGTPLSALLVGGPQERNRRGGTENVVGILAFAEATKIANENMTYNYKAVKSIKEYSEKCLLEFFGEKIIINSTHESSPFILSVTFKSEYFRNDAEAMLMFLDINGIAASNGAACTSGTLKPSHVLKAMGLKLEDAQGTIRLSFNPNNTKEEVDRVIEVLQKMSNNFEI